MRQVTAMAFAALHSLAALRFTALAFFVLTPDFLVHESHLWPPVVISGRIFTYSKHSNPRLCSRLSVFARPTPSLLQRKSRKTHTRDIFQNCYVCYTQEHFFVLAQGVVCV
jgi:hypothetical protein